MVDEPSGRNAVRLVVVITLSFTTQPLFLQDSSPSLHNGLLEELADRLSERVLVSTVREVVFIAKTIPPPARAVAIGSWSTKGKGKVNRCPRRRRSIKGPAVSLPSSVFLLPIRLPIGHRAVSVEERQDR
jgi:hypothetical protein